MSEEDNKTVEPVKGREKTRNRGSDGEGRFFKMEVIKGNVVNWVLERTKLKSGAFLNLLTNKTAMILS